MGEILAYFEKYYGLFLNAWFVEKEMSNNKNLGIIWFAYSRGVRKSLFRCSICQLWVFIYGTSKQSYAINQFFLIDFAFVCSEEKWYTEKLTQHLILPFMANTMVQIVTQYVLCSQVIIILVIACNKFSQYLAYKLIFLLLLLHRAVTPKVISIWSWNLARQYYIWLGRL